MSKKIPFLLGVSAALLIGGYMFGAAATDTAPATAPAAAAPVKAPASLPAANAAAKPTNPAAPAPVVAAPAGGASAERGKALFAEKVCSSCHTIDGTQTIGPTLKGVHGAAVTLVDGSTVTADDAYMKESILDASAKVVKGFQPGMMPAYKGQLTEAQVADLVAYIKTLK